MAVTDSTTGGQASAGNGRAKRKRTKKSKRRTTALEAEDDDSSSASSSSDSDNDEKPKAVQRARRSRASPVSSSSSESSSSDDESEDEKEETVVSVEKAAPEKRHRKRTRKPKQQAETSNKEGGDDANATQNGEASTHKQQATVDHEAVASLPDPQSLPSINEATGASLAYAKQYILDRSAWKFNKARQEHLIRHMTSHPPTSDADAHAATADENAKADDQDPSEEVASVAPGWPDEWNACVAAYLATVQGGAKERLVQRLRSAAQQIVPAPAPSADVIATEPSAPATAPSVAGTSTAPRSVSFGDMAMNDQNQSGSTSASDETRERIAFERQRARSLLSLLNESIW